MGEMQLRAKHNLEGCVCYVPGDSQDTFIVKTAGLYRSVMYPFPHTYVCARVNAHSLSRSLSHTHTHTHTPG